MWFLGAGVSRTAGIPSAMDIIWDLKRKYYCLQENQDLEKHKTNSNPIRQKIQTYLEGKGFPSLGSDEEYSFYFDLTFASDYASQQKYISELVNPSNLSLSIGQRVFAGLLDMSLIRIVFTTNFDNVIETAFSQITGKTLSAFHLEGSYAALDALNNEKFPIYAKVHGDFRYRSIKNLSLDLRSNDKSIQKCFIVASNRFGAIVSGYSGRDENVMEMFKLALNDSNPFPLGLYWLVPNKSSTSKTVQVFIELARSKGVNAYIVEVGTFDTILLKIWRQLPYKKENLDSKICTAKSLPVSIRLPEPSTKYPILRTNALAITNFPKTCLSVKCVPQISSSEFYKIIDNSRLNSIVCCYRDRILFWGDSDEVKLVLGKERVKEVETYSIENPIAEISSSGTIHSFYEQGLSRSILYGKPLLLRYRHRSGYIVIRSDVANDPLFQQLKQSLSYSDNQGIINGKVPYLPDTTWAEAISFNIENRGNSLWLLIEPDIWISPLSMRENARDFLRSRKLMRYNNRAYDLLNAWITILFGSIGGQEVSISCFPGLNYAPNFTVNTRTAFAGQLVK